ncbi:MAG: bifunctional demethylmenaquinone methyltransferase/2-methoxy-6-polyprenyl-1,4-benzoquinol methylase UbiE [Cytophagales bacterium]|nr:bifunctional demethylmenaquinone methyltransferase/2-methoxy-6-polyprenyl-1,4-benzoquinol methylase UbiE [Armatimonadota bacterium]
MAVEAPLEPETVGAGKSSALPTPEKKHEYVRAMFDAIAPRYDLLNSVLSARMHHQWRRVAASEACLAPGGTALDVCTGTGDLAFELARRVGKAGAVIGSDFSAPMLSLGEKKRSKSRSETSSVRFALADTQSLPFPSSTFDAVTVGFGIRNVADIPLGLREMARVTRPGGRVVLLEFNQPQNPLFAALYRSYSFHLLPFFGGLVSGRRAAYEYLPSSVAAFYSREALSALLQDAGLRDIRITELAFGAVVVHSGVKPLTSGDADIRPTEAGNGNRA